MKNQFKTLAEFISVFNNEEACREYFEKARFAQGEYCPHCKHDKIMHFADGKRYRCFSCKKDFTIKTGTLFGESKISLQKWLYHYLISQIHYFSFQLCFLQFFYLLHLGWPLF